VSCSQTQELDLTSFLADANRSEFAAFREHYPSCAECSAEVRAWTELHQVLTAAGAEAAHPSEEGLLRFEQQPESLSAAECRAIETHLESCLSCKDELRTLRDFDFASLDTSPVTETRASRAWLEGLAARLRGLVWHPAFAYALVLSLLVPIIAQEWRAPRQDAGTAGVPDLEIALLEKMQEGIASYDEAVKDAPERRIAPATPTPAVEEEFAAPRGRIAPAARGFAKERNLRAYAEPGGLAFSLVEADTPALELAPGKQANIEGARAREGLRLSLPLAMDAREEGVLEVRVVDPAGRRELRERIRVHAGQTHVELELPAGWLSTGPYRIELRVPDAKGDAVPLLEGFTLNVR